MDPLPLLNFFTEHASKQVKNVWPVPGKRPTPSLRSPYVTAAFAKAVDTLTAVCLSQANKPGQKVALTVTLPPDDRVIITLAENRCGVEDTGEFLQQLWVALKSLKSSPGESAEKSNDIFVIVFRHGVRRLKRRIKPLWEDAMKFYAFWQASTTKSGDENIHGRLTAVFDILRTLVDNLSEANTPTRAQIVDIVTQMDVLYRHCEALANARARVKQWCNEYAQASEDAANFPLRQYLRGCLDLYINTMSLIDLTTNPDFDDMFGRTLHLKSLQPEISPLDYPLDKSYWESYIADILDRCEIMGTKIPKFQRAMDEEITHAIATAEKIKSAPLHCELRLLSHHHMSLASPPEHEVEAETATPPRNYIGTSEPPCYACGVCFHAYREKSPYHMLNNLDRMYTQSPILRVDVPWAMPNFGNAQLDRSIHWLVFLTFCLDYAKFICHQFGLLQLPHSLETKFKWAY
ncbi:hypothetical protein BD410DRAFT_900523 [Rickenella mellea]|uniref:Uncharacterized protein n=1 Tax=Rickenella mellea TaxID=50990 RepID=A0A4Y7PV81_9AGAM|nr:hypothetical protein BD410DRAFT_900523 [Rickenella mellea]